MLFSCLLSVWREKKAGRRVKPSKSGVIVVSSCYYLDWAQAEEQSVEVAEGKLSDFKKTWRDVEVIRILAVKLGMNDFKLHKPCT